MTREGFIQVLEEGSYSYKIEGDKIVVLTGTSNEFTYHIFVDLRSLKSLPPGVVFKNRGDVHLESLKSLPPGVEFKNGGHLHLESLKSLPPDVQFRTWDEGMVYLNSLTSIPPEVQFSTASVRLDSIVGDEWFSQWKGNIKGINSRRLFNLMIKQGVFER